MHRAASSYTATQSGAPLTDDEIVRTYAELVDRAARRISARTGNTVMPGDLWSAGALGLLDAYRRFDPARGAKFESFADHRIRGAMMDELREMDHLPRRLRAETDRLRRARQALGNTLSREPTLEELADHLRMPIEDVEALETLSRPSVALPAELELPSLDLLQDDQLDHAARVQRVTEAIATLPPRLQLVLSLHYVEGLTYKEIALALEVSEARVCQIHGEAVKKLRGAVAAEP
jgi:RNA polymerase sigma factor for flagellar operon FliA